MTDAEEVNMGSDGIVLNMKESSRSKMKEIEDEHLITLVVLKNLLIYNFAKMQKNKE